MSSMTTQATPENTPVVASAGASTNASPPPRILFLDDDPLRAEIFLAENPQAVWVETAEACIARLSEDWDEVHLDHDLGGERFVDLSREDCGMAVVRWLCLEPHPHLAQTRFLIHTHNPIAASLMTMQIHLAGFQVESRPFGMTTTPTPAVDPFWNQRPGWRDRLAKLRALALRVFGHKPEDVPGATASPDSLPESERMEP
jgi:hypothetical protein